MRRRRDREDEGKKEDQIHQKKNEPGCLLPGLNKAIARAQPRRTELGPSWQLEADISKYDAELTSFMHQFATIFYPTNLQSLTN